MAVEVSRRGAHAWREKKLQMISLLTPYSG
jgi:hypothetical protein